MNSRFLECLDFVLEREGGYVNNPHDRGGATNKGITQKTYDDYRTRKGLNRQPVLGISAEELQEIYYSMYWLPAACDHMPAPVDIVVFDTAVNSGPGRAVKFLQRLVNTKQDGAFGPKTLAAISQYIGTHGAKNMARDLIALREGFIDGIIENDPSQVVFAKGWHNRLGHLRTEVSDYA